MSISIEVKGLDEIMELLDRMEPKASNKLMLKATADAAKKVLAPQLRAATPWQRMKTAVRSGQAKRDKPAGIVRYDAKKAWFRHFLLGGTRAHAVNPKRAQVMAWEEGGAKAFSEGHSVSGIRANPVISRVANQYGDEALEHVEDYLIRAFDL